MALAEKEEGSGKTTNVTHNCTEGMGWERHTIAARLALVTLLDRHLVQAVDLGVLVGLGLLAALLAGVVFAVL